MTGPLRTLYVEDEADIREVAQFALDGEGFELTLCDCGQDALERAVHLEPDLILLDVMMPHMDGPTTLRRLRELPHLAATPVIFMTAKVQATEVAQFKALGAVAVIAKPFDPMRLGAQIRSVLREHEHA